MYYYPQYYGSGYTSQPSVYTIPTPETKAEFIRKFVSEHYNTNFDIGTLVSDASLLWDVSVKVTNEKV